MHNDNQQFHYKMETTVYFMADIEAFSRSFASSHFGSNGGTDPVAGEQEPERLQLAEVHGGRLETEPQVS